ncbi:MAG: glycosyltransferase [Thermoleophilia bacterium]|nr:glycosyltransferase [Thermoleophilia bacterium]
MRVALVSSLLPSESAGGAEQYISQAVDWLTGRHDVYVLSGSPAGALTATETVRLPRLVHPRRDEALPRKLVWHLRDQWLPNVHRALVHHLARIQPDVVWTHEPQGLSAAPFTAVARLGLPHVHTAHDLNLLCARVTMTKDGRFCGGRCAPCLVQRAVRARAAARRLDWLLAVSDYIRERHVSAGVVSSDRAVTLRLGARPGRARVREGTGPLFRLGYLGGLAQHKGVQTLLTAFRDAPRGWRLTLAGRGELAGAVEQAAASDDRIRALGYVSGEAKEAFFDELDLLVVPSEWEEPATFVAVEAAIRGIPALVSDRGGLPETPEATLFQAGSAADLLRRARELADAPGGLAAASARLLEARERFSWSRHMERAEEYLLAATEPHRRTTKSARTSKQT